MPLPYQLPASLRYFKARLRPLVQPPVWGTAIFISVVGLVAWEHWLNPLRPDWQKNEVIKSNNPAYPSLSREDSRIGADIDSLPVLLHDFGQSFAPAVPIAPNKKTQATKIKESFQESLAQKQAISTNTQSTSMLGTGTPASPTPNLENPFLVQAQKLLQASSLDRETSLGVNPNTASSQPVAGQTSGSSLGIQLPSGTGQNQGVATISPLPPALNPSAAANLAATPTISPQAPTNASGQSLPTSALPSQISPATMGLPGETGHIARSYSVQVPSQAPRSYTNPRFNSDFGASGLQQSQLQQPN